MPRLLAAKTYPALVDVYSQIVVQNEIDGQVSRVWDYDSPTTYRCNFTSLKGHSEQYGEKYAETDAVKLEVRPEDGAFITLELRFGNIRMAQDETEEYYQFVGRRADDGSRYVFNVDAINPQVDTLGRVVCVEVYGVLIKVS